MATKSWLQDAKSIHDFRDDYYIQKPGARYDSKQDDRADRRIRDRYLKPIPVSAESLLFEDAHLGSQVGVFSLTLSSSR